MTEVNPLEATKLRLLSHSKNMLDAAQQHDWTRFSALENGWIGMLQSSVNQYGDELMDVGLEILKDNQKIKICFELKQKVLLKELGNNTKNISSIKSYLE